MSRRAKSAEARARRQEARARVAHLRKRLREALAAKRERMRELTRVIRAEAHAACASEGGLEHAPRDRTARLG
jgi:hypothetical protein